MILKKMGSFLYSVTVKGLHVLVHNSPIENDNVPSNDGRANITYIVMNVKFYHIEVS